MLNFIFIFEIIGTAAYAVMGALTAIKRKMDMFGTVVLGVTTATGGGIIRDVILGYTPPRTFRYPVYAAVATIFSVIVIIPFIRKRFIDNNKIYEKIIFILDTVGLGLFTIMGVGIAYETSGDYSLFLVVFVGVITGVGGGVLRDIFSGSIPYIFIKHIYACASIAGAIVCAVMWNITEKSYAMITGMIIIVMIRCLSAYFKWNLPVSREREEKNEGV